MAIEDLEDEMGEFGDEGELEDEFDEHFKQFDYDEDDYVAPDSEYEE